jgi:hypothetical protein
MSQTTNPKAAAIAAADAHLNNVSLPTYTELMALLLEAQELGLTFSIGSAYISRQYIDKQRELSARIDAAKVLEEF